MIGDILTKPVQTQTGEVSVSPLTMLLSVAAPSNPPNVMMGVRQAK